MSDGNTKYNLGCLTIPVGIAGLAATLFLGPVDISRSVYNQIVGDTPVLKRELVEYCRRGVAQQYSTTPPSRSLSRIEQRIKESQSPESSSKVALPTKEQLERSTASKLEYKLEGDKINPAEVGIEELWDCAEDYAPSVWQQWVWTSLK